MKNYRGLLFLVICLRIASDFSIGFNWKSWVNRRLDLNSATGGLAWTGVRNQILQFSCLLLQLSYYWFLSMKHRLKQSLAVKGHSLTTWGNILGDLNCLRTFRNFFFSDCYWIGLRFLCSAFSTEPSLSALYSSLIRHWGQRNSKAPFHPTAVMHFHFQVDRGTPLALCPRIRSSTNAMSIDFRLKLKLNKEFSSLTWITKLIYCGWTIGVIVS